MSSEYDYDALGLVAGLEIHQQLDTDEKLFCRCPTELREPEAATRRITRYLHPTRSELGELDDAALEETRVQRTFEYLLYDTTCLVEADEEPPRRLNDAALEITLQIASLLEMTVVDEIQVMRKIVVDGSNTTGFQRTAKVAVDGAIETDAGAVRIDDLMLEEESAKRVAETEDGVRYGLDRLGIPLVEIGTKPDITTPEQARAAAEHIGMLLRSTGAVRRGLGTIRQDVNVSIDDGARVEIKGVQSLDDIDQIVRNEVRRQVELLDIAASLRDQDAAIGSPVDVTHVFEDTESDLIADLLAEGGVASAVCLAGFDNLLGRTLQPDRRLGTELADHAKRHGAGGIFHTDELPAYGITEETVTTLRDAVDAGPRDAVALVVEAPETATVAIEAVRERATQAIDGVPEETRGAQADTTTEYLRPLPGDARMYPETDVPPVVPDLKTVETPELLTEKVQRYRTQYGLAADLAERVAFGHHMPVFESAVEAGVDPTLAADTLESRLTELRRDGVSVGDLPEESLVEALIAAENGEIPNEALDDLLRALAADPAADVSTVIERDGLGGVSETDIEAVVDRVVERNSEQVHKEGMDAFSALMGECMADLRGKADGEVVSRLLREKLQQAT